MVQDSYLTGPEWTSPCLLQLEIVNCTVHAVEELIVGDFGWFNVVNCIDCGLYAV